MCVAGCVCVDDTSKPQVHVAALHVVHVVPDCGLQVLVEGCACVMYCPDRSIRIYLSM